MYGDPVLSTLLQAINVPREPQRQIHLYTQAVLTKMLQCSLLHCLVAFTPLIFHKHDAHDQLV